MIWYLFDLLVNNLNLFVCATVLFNIGNYEKRDYILLLFIDIFINDIPVIFVSLLILNVLNKWVKLKFVNSSVLYNLLFLFNYFVFFLVIYNYKNSRVDGGEFLNFYLSNFLINYILFLLIKRTKVKYKTMIWGLIPKS